MPEECIAALHAGSCPAYPYQQGVQVVKKVRIASMLFLFCAALSFGDHFFRIGMIINESDENIYCTSRVKEDVKEILDFKKWASKENQKFYGGVIPFYWRGNYITDIKGTGVWEHTEKTIFNTLTQIDLTLIPNELILFQAESPMEWEPPAPSDEGVTDYHMKLIQLLDYFFSEIILYDGDGNVFLTLEDLREYYDGLADEEIRKDLGYFDMGDYFIIITQDMIDQGRRKYSNREFRSKSNST
jgi:hypothetical protein